MLAAFFFGAFGAIVAEVLKRWQQQAKTLPRSTGLTAKSQGQAVLDFKCPHEFHTRGMRVYIL